MWSLCGQTARGVAQSTQRVPAGLPAPPACSGAGSLTLTFRDHMDAGGGRSGPGGWQVHRITEFPYLSHLVQLLPPLSGSLGATGFLFVSTGEISLTVQLHTKKLHVDPDRLHFLERDRGMAHQLPFSTVPKPRTQGTRIPRWRRTW